jgi:hypothetical protein
MEKNNVNPDLEKKKNCIAQRKYNQRFVRHFYEKHTRGIFQIVFGVNTINFCYEI